MKERNKEANCGNCPYMVMPKSPVNPMRGQCRRYPPRVCCDCETQAFPLVSHGDVCGEHPEFVKCVE